MKKEYISPATEWLNMETASILAASAYQIPNEWGSGNSINETGQILSAPDSPSVFDDDAGED